MTYNPVSRTVPQYSKDGDELAAAYYLKGYTANTTNPLSMATDNTGGTLLAKCKLSLFGEPLSNAADETSVFIPHFNATYKLALYKNEADADADTVANAQWVVDDIQHVDPLPNYDHGGTNSVARTYASRLQDMRSVFDWFTAAQVTDVRGNTGAVDVTAAVQAAHDAATGPACIVFPPGTYLIDTSVNITTDDLTFLGYGALIKGAGGLSPGANATFEVDCNGFHCHGFDVEQATNASFIQIQSAAANRSDFCFTDITCKDHFYTINPRGNTSFRISDVRINNVRSVGPNGSNHGHFLCHYTDNVTITNCRTQYGQNASCYGFFESSVITVTGCVATDNGNTVTSDASLQIEDCQNAKAVIVGNTFDHDIWIDDSDSIEIGPNFARNLRFTVNEHSNFEINVTGGSYTQIRMTDIGTPGAFTTNATISGVQIDPARNTELYPYFLDAEFVGEVRFNNCHVTSNGSSSQLQLARHANQDIQFVDCDFNSALGSGISGSGGTLRAKGCTFLISENRGAATINSGATSATVTHGINAEVVPAGVLTEADIQVTLTEQGTNDPGNIWVDTITATQFNVNCRNDPGASNLSFGWHARANFP